MCSAVSPSSLFLSSNTRHLLHRRNASLLNNSHPIVVTRRPINRWSTISATITERNVVDLSWCPPEHNAADDYGGWAIVEAPAPKTKKKGLPPLVMVGIGTSMAVVVTAIAGYSISKRGFDMKFGSLLNASHGISRSSSQDQAIEITETGNDASPDDVEVLVTNSERLQDAADHTVISEANRLKSQVRNLGRIIVPVAVDSTQQEALLVLKKLKVVEDDVKADALCTRREYARWFVRENMLLERNPKHRIVPDAALSGSIYAAFDDVALEDPDFGAIQSLAEAGIIPSNLLTVNSSSDLHDSKDNNNSYFYPERFISRQDLIDWKAQLEYQVKEGINEKISRSNMGFMDAGEISPGVSPQFYVDMLSGDKSILKKVFGKAKRFQPHKPSTNAQAAVALTSGRMTESIKAELSRLEAEISSREKAMEDIRFELLHRGDISRYWDEKLEEERMRATHVNRIYLTALADLEQEKVVQENSLAEILKERAAMDCQKQLLLSLKEEIDAMSERVVRESTEYAEQKQELQVLLADAQARLERTHNAKSVLETELEALQILRSWIEDEARKSQARAKVLEDAGRRWKWDDQD